jgi:hypothetical protein
MRFSWFVFPLFVGIALAQAPSSTAPARQNTPPATQQDEDDEAEAKPAAAPSSIPPEAAVITIKGLCDDKSPKSSTAVEKNQCETVISRAEFERLADALQPGMPATVRRQLATAYPRLLLLAQEAKKRGLESQPGFQEKMGFARLQILTQELNRSLQEQASQVPEKEIEQYYHDNSTAFEQATLLRIFVPRSKQIEASKTNKPTDPKPDESQAQQKAAEEAMTTEANKLHGRAAAGEDFEKLQKEAFEFAGLKASAPSSNLGKVRRMNLPPSQASVMDLKAGDVSQVINDPSGHYIYKMVSKEVSPLPQVKDEIRNTLQSQKMKDAMQAIQQSGTTELNDAYFGTAPSGPGPVPVKPKPDASKESPQTKSPQPK